MGLNLMRHNEEGTLSRTMALGTAICVRPPIFLKKGLMMLFAGTICVLLAIAAPSLSQSGAASVPENAHAKSYGEGWDCDLSFRLEGDQCVAIAIPQNAYPTNRPYGVGWECHHGFQEMNGDTCAEVPVPPGGYLDASGEQWKCLRGFRRLGTTCQKIELPDHSYLSEDSYGSDWNCDRGYKVNGSECVAIVVPENAYLNSKGYGSLWTCERGYIEAKGKCTAVVVPQNAYFYDASYGSGWKCERGFKAVSETCVKIVVPENAHLDRSGNRWSCNKNFRRSKGLCRLND